MNFSEMELQQVMNDGDTTTSAEIDMKAQRMGTTLSEEQQIKKALFKDNSLTNRLMEKICNRNNNTTIR